VTLAPDKVATFLASQAEELTRIWRLARAAARPEVFPGLIDALVMPFFLRASELLPAGAAPEEVWAGMAGVLRWAPAVKLVELTNEWEVLVEVVNAACESVNAGVDAEAWLTRAVDAAEAGAVAIARGERAPPTGVVAVLVFSSVAPRKLADEAPAG
jgi:hypothetical protein